MSKRGLMFIPSQVSLEAFVGTVPAHYNVLASPHDFTDAVSLIQNISHNWTYSGTGASISGYSFIGPDSFLSAQKLTENSAAGNHFVAGPSGDGGTTAGSGVAFNSGFVAPVKLRYALIVKASGRNRVVIRGGSANAFTGSTYVSSGFDLAGGNTGYDTANDAAVWGVPVSSMRSLGGDWWLCMMDALNSDIAAGAMAANNMAIFMDNGSGTGARSISYTGDGTSGVLLYWASILPVAAWGNFQQVFFDDFNSISTIDVNDTRAEGFNWYTHNTWPHSWGGDRNTGITTPASFISVSNSILTISDDASGFGSGIATAAANPSNSTTRVGQVYGPAPLLMEARMAWDITVPTVGGDTNGPAWWAAGYAGKVIDTYPQKSAELDIIEVFANSFATISAGLSAHHWTATAIGVATDIQLGSPWNTASRSQGTSDFRNYACFVYSPASNDGSNGGEFAFVDGIFHPAGFSGWGMAPANFYTLHTDQYVLLLGARHSGGKPAWPMICDWVKVFS